MAGELESAVERLREMFEPGCVNDWPNASVACVEDMATVVAAYLASPPKRLKPLAWDDKSTSYSFASTPFGTYRCSEKGWDLVDSKGRQLGGGNIGRCETRPRAEFKELALSDYARRVAELHE